MYFFACCALACLFSELCARHCRSKHVCSYEDIFRDRNNTYVHFSPTFLSLPLPKSTLLFSFCISTATVDAAAAKPADAATASAAPAGTVTAEEEASAKAAEAAMKEKIERLSGHMFAVM